ncbi:unnamed protein product, partial [Discosporangium mesarthrocarpum]
IWALLGGRVQISLQHYTLTVEDDRAAAAACGGGRGSRNNGIPPGVLCGTSCKRVTRTRVVPVPCESDGDTAAVARDMPRWAAQAQRAGECPPYCRPGGVAPQEATRAPCALQPLPAGGEGWGRGCSGGGGSLKAGGGGGAGRG